MNDITVITSDKSNAQLTKFLSAMNNGTFFDFKTGMIKEEMGVEYFKVISWSFDPVLKGPGPQSSAKGNDNDAYFLIDG